MGLFEDRVYRSMGDGGKYGGGSWGQLVACFFWSGERDGDLRWVPPGAWKDIHRKTVQDRFSPFCFAVATGVDHGVSLVIASNRSGSTSAVVVLGDYGGFRFVQTLDPRVSASAAKWRSDGKLLPHLGGSFGRGEIEQRIPGERFWLAMIFKVNRSSLIHKVSLRLDLVMRTQKTSGIDGTGGWTLLRFAIYPEALILELSSFICYVGSEYYLSNACLIMRNVKFIVFVLAVLLRHGLRQNREGMEALVDFLSVWLFEDNGRIILFNLSSGAVYAVQLRLDMCLLNVYNYTVLMPANHVPVQYVWNHCSFLSWIGESAIGYLDVGIFLSNCKFLVLLEFHLSGNLVRNHFDGWFLFEANLAAMRFVKASWDCSHLYNRVYRAPLQTWLCLHVIPNVCSFCIVVCFNVWFVSCYFSLVFRFLLVCSL